MVEANVQKAKPHNGNGGRPQQGVDEIHILWISEGMSCDGDTVSVTAASLPSIEDVVLGLIPGIPKVHLHNKVLAYETGEDFVAPFRAAARGELGPFILVIEGSVPNEKINGDGFWSAFGNGPDGQPMPLTDWIDALAPRAWAVVAAGTCATYGGIHAMAGNPTGCMGLADYLGWDFRTTETKLPIVNIPGCPVQPDNFMETLLWVLRMAAGTAPVIPLDSNLRPTWLFGKTVHEGCDRAGYYEQADFAADYNSPKCQVKIGCWGPVVNCNVPKRGWMRGIGGCPNVGGVCIACTMPGFPDKFMPFMDQPPGSTLSSMLISPYGALIRALRGITNRTANEEPKWHHNRPALTTGYQEERK
jgi:hydrogenase small subunit